MTTGSPPGNLGPLAGVRILDLALYPPGSFATMLLADFGAEVIVVDPPPSLKSDRAPALAHTPGSHAWRDRDRAAAHDALRRNKRSIIANLKHPDGVAVVRDLAARSDVVVEGYRPGVASRLGIGYDDLRPLRPGLIYCSVTGYGQVGPLADFAGHDLNYISYAGVESMMRTAAGAAAIPANLVADFAGGGLMAAFAIMTALWARSASGGQHIDMAMTDGAMYLAASQFSRTLAGEADAEPGGGRLTGGNPNYQVYECADGQLLAVAPVEPGFWRRVAEAVGLPHLTTPADSPPQARSRTSELARVLRSRDRASWLEIIGAEASCVSPVLSLAEAIAHPNATARDMVVIVHDPDYGAIPQIGIGPKLSATPGAARTHSARPGEHTDAILRELGRSPAEIRRLVDTSAVSRRTPRTVSADER